MKFLILATILSSTAFAQKYQYGLGVESGLNSLSKYQSEASKSGYSLGVKAFVNYQKELLTGQFSLGYQNMQLEGEGVRIITKSVFSEVGAKYRVIPKVDLGLGLKFIGGTDNTNSENIGKSTIDQSLYLKASYQVGWFETDSSAFVSYGRSYNQSRPLSSFMVGLEIPLDFGSKKTLPVKEFNDCQPLKVNLNITHVKFAKNKFQLKENDLNKLKRLALFLRQYNNAWKRLKIMGHTDITGDEQLNKVLSQDRADEVLKALIENGTDESKMTAQGYGSSLPLVDLKNESAYTQNRRVEIEIYNVSNRVEFNEKLSNLLKGE